MRMQLGSDRPRRLLYEELVKAQTDQLRRRVISAIVQNNGQTPVRRVQCVAGAVSVGMKPCFFVVAALAERQRSLSTSQFKRDASD